MTLLQLIEKLEALPAEAVFKQGFGRAHSYRGYYYELAFSPADNVTVGAMLEAARSANGATYEGWKGGGFTMGLSSEVHLAADGEIEDSDDAMERLFVGQPVLARAKRRRRVQTEDDLISYGGTI